MSDFKQDMLNKSVKPIKVENNSITGQINHSHTTKLLLMGCSFQIKRTPLSSTQRLCAELNTVFFSEYILNGVLHAIFF